jgi:hypothetical protein
MNPSNLELAGGSLFRVGVKYLSGPDSLDRALKWGIILERPVEVWEKGGFRVMEFTPREGA